MFWTQLTDMKWCLLLGLLLQNQLIINAKYILEMLYFGNCKESDSTAPLRLENSHYGMVSSDISEFNSTLVITQDFEKVQAMLTVFKCKDDNCETLVRIPAPDQCIKMTERGQFWSVFADTAQPPIKCPYKKGTHQITHARVSPNMDIMRLVEDHCIYRLEFVFTYKGKYAGCWRANAKKTKVRNKKS